MLTDKQVEQFQAIYKARFGKDISKEEAHEKGMRLVCLMRQLYKPTPTGL